MYKPVGFKIFFTQDLNAFNPLRTWKTQVVSIIKILGLFKWPSFVDPNFFHAAIVSSRGWKSNISLCALFITQKMEHRCNNKHPDKNRRPQSCLGVSVVPQERRDLRLAEDKMFRRPAFHAGNKKGRQVYWRPYISNAVPKGIWTPVAGVKVYQH